jgi:hypothetical protein
VPNGSVKPILLDEVGNEIRAGRADNAKNLDCAFRSICDLLSV